MNDYERNAIRHAWQADDETKVGGNVAKGNVLARLAQANANLALADAISRLAAAIEGKD